MELIDAVGEALPLPDDSVDCVLFAYVLCSVDSVEDVLAEARGCCTRTGPSACSSTCVPSRGRGPSGCSASVSVGGLWPRLIGGCECRRDTRAALADAGFHVEDLAERTLVNVPVVSWTLMGSSRP